jgi:hypothetical protein
VEKADDFRVSLCINHPVLRPDAISTSLKVQPQFAWGVGDIVGSRVRNSTLWRGTLVEGSGAANFERALEDVLSMLSSSKGFLYQITSSGGELSLSVRVVADVQEGKAAEMRLNASFLGALAHLNIDLIFEVWMNGAGTRVAMPELPVE